MIIYIYELINIQKTSRYFEYHNKYIKLFKSYLTATLVIINAESTFNQLSEYWEIRFTLRKVIRQSVTSFHLPWNMRCSYCCVLCHLHGRFVHYKQFFMLCYVAKDIYDMEKKCKNYPRQYCRVEEHNDWKFLELHVQGWRKKNNRRFCGFFAWCTVYITEKRKLWKQQILVLRKSRSSYSFQDASFKRS